MARSWASIPSVLGAGVQLYRPARYPGFMCNGAAESLCVHDGALRVGVSMLLSRMDTPVVRGGSVTYRRDGQRVKAAPSAYHGASNLEEEFDQIW